MSRSNRNWPQGIRACSKCGALFKQLASLANHTRICTAAKKSAELPDHPGYPPDFQALLDKRAAEEAQAEAQANERPRKNISPPAKPNP